MSRKQNSEEEERRGKMTKGNERKRKETRGERRREE